MPCGGKAIHEVQFEDVLPSSPLSVCMCGCCSVLNFILIILFFPCTVTQLGQFKYGLVKNKITGTVNLESSFEPGRYWIGFWKEFIEFPSTLNTIEFSDEQPEEGVQQLSKLVCRDMEGKAVSLDVSIQYRLLPDKLGQTYKDMTVLYEDVFISDLRDKFAKAANTFVIEDAWQDQKYATIVAKMLNVCREQLLHRNAECWGLQLWGVTVTKQLEDKLVKTQVQKQKQVTITAKKTADVVRSETKVLLAEYEANIKKVVAEQQANEILITREAKAGAEAAIVEAQAQVLKIIKDIVNLNNITNGNYNGPAAPAMTDAQLITYQKYVMLTQKDDSHVVVNLADGLGSVNTAASMNVMNGNTR